MFLKKLENSSFLTNREQQEEDEGGGQEEPAGVQVRLAQAEHRHHGRGQPDVRQAEAEEPQVLRLCRQQGQEGNHRAGW